VGFDPRDYVDKQLPGLDVLREELDTIYNNVDDTLHQILSDSTLLENKDVL
jgi:hypothetical protein